MGRSADLTSTRLLLLLLIGIAFLKPVRGEEVYYLLDNSGSMYDGYPAPKSGAGSYYYRRPEFQAFLKQVVAVTARPEDSVSIVTFNRVTNVVQPPIKASQLRWEALLPPTGKLDVVGVNSADDIKFTRMPDAVRELLARLGGRKAVLWMLTDNIVDQGASQEAADTREFYSLLAKDPRVQMVYAYPMQREPINRISTLMLYGIVLGSQQPFNLEELKRWEEEYISAERVREFMGGAPFQMKPLERNTVELRLKEELKLDAVDEDSPLSGTVEINIVSKFNYHVITSATIELIATDLEPERASISRVSGSEFSFSPEQPYTVKNIRPRSEASLNVTFTTPRVTVNPSRNGFSTLFADIFDEEFRMQGSLKARVKDVQLRLELPENMRRVFGAGDIPQIFRPEIVDMDELQMEMAPKVKNSGGRLLLFLLLGTLLVSGMIALGVWLLLPQSYYLSFDEGFEFYKVYNLRRKGEAVIKSDSGEVLGRLCRDWGTGWKFMPNRNDFKRVSDIYSNVALARLDADERDISYKIYIRTKRPASKATMEE